MSLHNTYSLRGLSFALFGIGASRGRSSPTIQHRRFFSQLSEHGQHRLWLHLQDAHTGCEHHGLEYKPFCPAWGRQISWKDGSTTCGFAQVHPEPFFPEAAPVHAFTIRWCSLGTGECNDREIFATLRLLNRVAVVGNPKVSLLLHLFLHFGQCTEHFAQDWGQPHRLTRQA